MGEAGRGGRRCRPSASTFDARTSFAALEDRRVAVGVLHALDIGARLYVAHIIARTNSDVRPAARRQRPVPKPAIRLSGKPKL